MSLESSVKSKCVFKIQNMSCGGCAKGIELDLSNMDGVLSINVNFPLEKAYVEFDKNKTSETEIQKRIQNSGFGAILETAETIRETFDVKGMSCANCAASIEQTIRKIEGVENVALNFSLERVTVVFDPTIITSKRITEIVNATGYTLSPLQKDLVPKDNAEDRAQKAKKNMTISIVLTSLIIGIMFINMWVVPVPGHFYISAILGLPIIFGTGRHIHKASIMALKNKRASMDVLVTLATIPAFLVGLLGFILPVHDFLELSTSIITFHLIGKYLEARAKGKASQAVRKLIQMGAKTATILRNDTEIEIKIEELLVGDVMLIRPGDKIPTDGIVLEGDSQIDESLATGESMPVSKKTGSSVIGATININGFLKVRATKVGKETFLSQVIQLVEECQGSKVPIQEFADKITGYFVPGVILLTTLTFVSFNLFPEFHMGIISWASQYLPWVNLHLSPLALSFVTATAVLVIACPCALGLGTPTAIMIGSAMGAEKGILIRNGEAVQTLKDIKMIVFDKTGTLTKGKPEVTDIKSFGDIDNSILLKFASSLEKGSEHPLARAIVEKAKSLDVSTMQISSFVSQTGKGVSGEIEGKKVFVGNSALMTENNIDISESAEFISYHQGQGKTVILVGINSKLGGAIAIADDLKDDSVKAIEVLNKMGIKTALVTGDNLKTAEAIARKTGITHIVAGVLPEGKVEEIIKLQKTFGLVAMVGDGINDAPALKQANVGIALGTGTEIAIEASDVTLVRGEIGAVISAIKLSRGIFTKIKENYFWAWFYNILAIPLAAFGLLHPLIGMVAMFASSINVVYNSMRLRSKNIEPFSI